MIWTQEVAYAVGALSTVFWLFVVIGIKEVSRVKRVMMQYSFDTENVPSLETALLQVPGVLEVTLNSKAGAVYLKVNSDFDAIKARDVLAA